MESGSIIYYGGNTIKRKRPSQSSVNKRFAQDAPIAPAEHVIPKKNKVFLTKNCLWCNREFDQFRLVCDICHNCQYCGLASLSELHCQNCDNHYPPDETPAPTPYRTIRFM